VSVSFLLAGLPKDITRFGALVLGTRHFLVSLEEFKNGHRDLSRNRFINAKQSKSRAKCPRGGGRGAQEGALGAPRPRPFTEVSPRKLGHVSSTPLACWAGHFLALDGQTRAVTFQGL
jgi:hypothetical protein